MDGTYLIPINKGGERMNNILLVIGFVGTLLQGIGIKTGAVSPGWLGLAAFIASFLV